LDRTTALLTEYASNLTYAALPPAVVHATKRTLIDTMGCAAGGYFGEPCEVARRVAQRVSSDAPARILGGRLTSALDTAAFANAAAIRYLDCNDTTSVASGHPRDMIGALLAVADVERSDGPAIMAAIVASYDVFGYLSGALGSGNGGWDQATMAAAGVACGAAKLMGLSREQMAHALAISLVGNLTLFVTRTGELSMWKGCATAGAARAAVFAAQLARDGMTGPDAPFEGSRGLWEQAVGTDVALPDFGPGAPGAFTITASTYKEFPCQVHLQAPIRLALDLRQQLNGEAVAAVAITTFATAVRQTGSEAEKWDPQTRETADHSMPYVVGRALRDGVVSPASFAEHRIKDPSLRPLLAAIRVQEDAAFTQRFPQERPCRMEVTTTAGRTLTAETATPKGHRTNPLSDAEVEAKFRRLTGDVLTAARQDAGIATLWSFGQARNVDALYDQLVVVETA